MALCMSSSLLASARTEDNPHEGCCRLQGQPEPSLFNGKIATVSDASLSYALVEHRLPQA